MTHRRARSRLALDDVTIVIASIRCAPRVPRGRLPIIHVDADGCPVKEEVRRVAKRCGLVVVLVANRRMHVRPEAGIRLVVVTGAFDAADDWIVEHAERDDIVVTADIPLASRCLARGARVLDHRGRIFTERSIGDVRASRDLASHLRDMGVMTGGHEPFGRRQRSAFLQALDDVIQAVRPRKR
jgi:hypothetical protein